MRGFGFSTIGLAVSILVATPALAQQASRLSTHNDWGSYAYTNEQRQKVCYVLSMPVDKQPSSLDHGDIYFLVTQKPGQASAFEPQFSAGYDMQENSKVTVRIGDRSFSLFVRGRSAWLENPAEEPQMIAAMRGGADMAIAAKSGRGNDTSYKFSLRGISAALASIQNCK
ncbi:invasion associated locus B family protein [Limoniibacter endophyticus]|nr:invasion associated locus B family protein [Limoniibacter endophyticus]